MRKFLIKVNGKQYEVEVEEVGNGSGEQKPQTQSAPAQAQQVNKQEKKSAPVEGGTPVTAPIPGTVLKINVNDGDTVKSGQVIVVLEAMKMENDIIAPCDGKVSINVQAGATVSEGDVLVTIS
jgi:glutaconyl-CoA/methylmalonyl-CoA decarboxylase subunit gamma